jgi:superkiller protein 3
LAFYSLLTIKQNYYWKDPIIFYERTLRYAPYSGRIFYNLANAYQGIGKHREAIVAYQKAMALSPDSATAPTYNRLGVSYALSGMPEEALSSFKKAVELQPYSVEAQTNLGNAYASMGKFEEAIASYKKAIEIDPNYTAAHDNLNNLYRQNPGLKRQ